MQPQGEGMAKRALPLLFVVAVMAVAFVAVIWGVSQADVLPSGVTSTRSSSTSSLAVGTVQTGSNETSPLVVTIVMPAGAAQADEIGYIPQYVTLVIGVNNTVKWINEDSADHTVTGDSGTWGSGNIGPGQTYTYTFTAPGVYDYHDPEHSWMVGIVTVKSG